jgi:hypothetical protein
VVKKKSGLIGVDSLKLRKTVNERARLYLAKMKSIHLLMLRGVL